MNNSEVRCPYCNNLAEWVENKEVYHGKNFGKSYMMYLCRPCDARVGCHNNTRKPLGSMANANLRQLRMTAKNLFIEKLMQGNWHCSRQMKEEAYRWVMKHLKIPSYQAHFGMFDEEQCLNLIQLLRWE